MEKIDAKFYAIVRKVKNDQEVPDDEYMIFLVHDNAFALVLPVYRAICEALGADQEHMAVLDRTIAKVNAWRTLNAEKCKVPDAKGEKLLF